MRLQLSYWLHVNKCAYVKTAHLVMTVSSTVIIVLRILMVSRMPGASHRPHIAMEIIVESAVLYSISALVLVPMLIPSSSHTAASLTFYRYVDTFFLYMAVESLPSSLPIPIS